MEEKIVKPLKVKLMEAVNNVLIDNQAGLTKKLEKVVRKSVKRIARRADKQR